MALIQRFRFRFESIRIGLRAACRDIRLALTMRPIAGADDGEGKGGDAGDAGDAGKGGEGEGGGDAGKGGDAGSESSGEGSGEGGEDWKAQARKHENRWKQEREKREKAEAELKKQADRDKSEEEKRIDAAREEGKREALRDAQKERRSDRLAAAVTRLAAKGVTVGEGEDAKTTRFADPEDALVFIERQLDRGDLDAGEIFDEENRVQTEALEDALLELLKSKPRLAADGEEGKATPGSADGGRGKGAGKGLEDMSPAEFDKRMRTGSAK